MAGNSKKRFTEHRFTDSYETEIKISLALLICFLLSLNFLTAYSLGKARQAQHDGYVLNMELVKENIRYTIEMDGLRKPDVTLLSDLAHQAFLDKIQLVDSLGNLIMMVGGIEKADEDDAITISTPIRDLNGDVVYYLFVSGVNREGQKLGRLALFDSIFRIAGLIAGLIVAFFFIKTVLNPYRKIKKEAAELDIDLVDLENTDDVEYAVRTFQKIIKELKEKENLLQSLYANSEKRADSLARYNDYILGGISSGVIICDNDGIITRFNPAADRILNINHTASQGSHYRDVFGKKNHVTKIFDAAVSSGRTFSRTEFEITLEGSEKRWIGLSSSLISDNQGNKMGAAVLLTDLTKIKKLQEISDFTEKMAAVGEMAAGLAHEFRNSVAAIMGFGKLIKKSLPEDNKAHNIAEMIISESQNTEDMLRRFLTFAKPLKVIPQPIVIGQIIGDSLQSAREGCPTTNIEISFVDNSNAVQIDGDPTLLKNAFSNLFINAFQAMGDTGALTVNLTLEPVNKQIIIKIADTGTGISADILPKIFNPFFTTKDKGTGLGLALVHKIITGHYGRIEVESRQGEGATFIIALPMERPNGTSETPDSEPKPLKQSALVD